MTAQRLLENLLEHEVLVAALFGHHRIPRDALRRLGARPPSKSLNSTPAPRDHRHLPIVQEDDVARVAEDRGDVGGDEVFVLADADDDRRPVARRDDLLRVVGDISTSAKSPRTRASARRTASSSERAPFAQRARHEVRDDLGVGLRLELVPGRLQLLLELEVVLDDAVVDDDRAAGVVAMRMRVLLGGSAVRGPARVADAVVAGRAASRAARLRASRACRRSAGRRCRRRRRPPRRPSRTRDTRGGAGPRREPARPVWSRCSRRCRTWSSRNQERMTRRAQSGSSGEGPRLKEQRGAAEAERSALARGARAALRFSAQPGLFS